MLEKWIVYFNAVQATKNTLSAKTTILSVDFCVLGMGFNKFPSWGNFITHQHTEYPICFSSAIDTNLF